ncbi:zinc-binding dehydrogenase [Pectobacterium peruviense]|uniref:Uncharacterized protein n=1 Tax=Pectobacterium peruviense TaxID=2066479 RepID=A0ABX4S6R9_9GAMM|nr:zinc-binding dehydrogenase [Pectobacterium peruviense]KML66167.1 hypothetical protein G033_15010 [Pectobacterium peruviense]PKX86252.1 hypothetical protein A0G03_12630 [Pectobacterium peruviense]
MRAIRIHNFTEAPRREDIPVPDIGHDDVRAGGRLISTVMPPDEEEARAHGVTASIFYAKPFADRLGDLVATIASRNVKVIIDRTVPLNRFDEAWDYQIYGHARGKIVVLSQ